MLTITAELLQGASTLADGLTSRCIEPVILKLLLDGKLLRIDPVSEATAPAAA